MAAGSKQSIIVPKARAPPPQISRNQMGATTVIAVPSPGEASSSAVPPSQAALRDMFARPLPCWHAAPSNPRPLSLTRSFRLRVRTSKSMRASVAPECLAILLTASLAIRRKCRRISAPNSGSSPPSGPWNCKRARSGEEILRCQSQVSKVRETAKQARSASWINRERQDDSGGVRWPYHRSCSISWFARWTKLR